MDSSGLGGGGGGKWEGAKSPAMKIKASNERRVYLTTVKQGWEWYATPRSGDMD